MVGWLAGWLGESWLSTGADSYNAIRNPLFFVKRTDRDGETGGCHLSPVTSKWRQSVVCRCFHGDIIWSRKLLGRWGVDVDEGESKAPQGAKKTPA